MSSDFQILYLINIIYEKNSQSFINESEVDRSCGYENINTNILVKCHLKTASTNERNPLLPV